jgi:hypothetical protein
VARDTRKQLDRRDKVERLTSAEICEVSGGGIPIYESALKTNSATSDGSQLLISGGIPAGVQTFGDPLDPLVTHNTSPYGS